MKMKKLVVFDWNGTLLADTVVTWRAANACLEFYGAPPISLSRFRETFDFPILHFYKRNGCCVDDVLERLNQANTVFGEGYQNGVKKLRLRKGARDLLNHLTEQNIDCTILSNARVQSIQPRLEQFKIEHYFKHICGQPCPTGASIVHKTSKRERLEKFLEERDYKPEHTVIIGDSAEEPEIARHLGLTSIGITDGYISQKRLRAARPNHIISTLSAIKSLV